MKHLEQKGNQKKKDPLHGYFFSYRPSADAALRSVQGIRALLAQRVMAKLGVLVLPVGQNLHVYVPTCTTKHGSVLLSRFAMPGLSYGCRMTYPLICLDPLIRWYRITSSIFKNRHLNLFCIAKSRHLGRQRYRMTYPLIRLDR